MKNVCVIGGGASGLMAAYAAAKNGHNVVLFEKNEKLGKKIYITGKGRCNFTNDIAPDEFLTNVIRGKKFLMSSLYSFPSRKTIDFFEDNGMPVKIERGNRAFPVSDHASDVTKALERVCKGNGVDVHLNEEVKNIQCTMPDKISTRDIEQDVDCKFIVCTSKTDYSFDTLIIATGGLSYPTTGSTGDGYRFAKIYGHNVTDLKPALCGFNVEGDWFKNLQGLALKNVSLTIKNGNKTICEDFGEMLFTHFGRS